MIRTDKGLDTQFWDYRRGNGYSFVTGKIKRVLGDRISSQSIEGWTIRRGSLKAGN